LRVDVANSAGGNSDVRFDVATDAAFTAIVWGSTSTNVPNGLLQAVASGLVSGTKYWWRARLAPTGTTTWGPWTAAQAFTPDINAGRGFAYVPVNVGADYPLDPDVTAAAYVDVNVGADYPLDPDVTAAAYVDANLGIEITRDPDAVEYAHVGDVNTLPPTPHLWFLRPAAGRAGDGISIVCFGVGDLVTTYSGSVQLYYGATIGWVNAAVTAWNTYPPTADAYTAARRLDPLAFYIDMQHTVIEIVVPGGALPPGYPLRIRTVTA